MSPGQRSIGGSRCVWDDERLEFFDVRAESVLADGRRIGVTSLVDDGDRALIQFGQRNWPDDESSHRLEWTLRSVINGTPRTADRRGGGDSPWDRWRLSCALGFARSACLIAGRVVGVTEFVLDRAEHAE